MIPAVPTPYMLRGMALADFGPNERALFLSAAKSDPRTWTDIDQHLVERYEAAQGLPLPKVRWN